MKILNLAFRRLAPLALLALALGGCVTSEAVSSYNKGVEARNLDTKITHYTKAIAADPNFARAYNNRGNAYNRKGLYDKALAGLTKAIELAPEDPAALVNRGIAYKNKGQFDRAIEDYDDAIHFKPDMVQAYGNRGNAFSLKGLYDKAINDQTKSIALAEAGRPSVEVVFPKVTAATVGQYLYMMELAVAIMGEHYGVDAFDQPGVEAGKIAAYALMGRAGFEARRQEIEASKKRAPKRV